MINKFLRINPQTWGESPSVNEKIANLNPMRCYSVKNLLEYFSKATSNALEYFLFPFLTLQEQCIRVLLAINVAQTINPPISLGEDQAEAQHAENNLALPATNLQPDSCAVDLTPELDLIIKTINSYTEDWAYDGINRTHWPVILSNSPGISQDFLDYWKMYYFMCRIQIKHAHETANSNKNDNENDNENVDENEDGNEIGNENENENQPTD